MPALVRAALLGAALAFANGLAAQEPPSAGESPEIVVTGQDMEQQIRDFVGALTQAPVRGQLSRFEESVCPAALGLSVTQKAAIVRRMRVVAKGVGLRVGKESCRANVVVIATDDKRAFIETLERRYPYFFGALPEREIRRLEREAGPAVAWQLQGFVNADGVAMPADPTTGTYVNRTMHQPSRIVAAARPLFMGAVVVVEKKALIGLTPIQLADYAAMRAFARTDPTRLPDPPPPTILTILDAPMGSSVPVTLTEWDLGFLRGLYGSDPNLYAESQRSAIKRRLGKELERSARSRTPE
jgi:hypothetical protein